MVYILVWDSGYDAALVCDPGTLALNKMTCAGLNGHLPVPAVHSCTVCILGLNQKLFRNPLHSPLHRGSFLIPRLCREGLSLQRSVCCGLQFTLVPFFQNCKRVLFLREPSSRVI